VLLTQKSPPVMLFKATETGQITYDLKSEILATTQLPCILALSTPKNCGKIPKHLKGRVGEEATPQGEATTSPLIEPDVRISLIRLSQKRSAGSMHRQLRGVSSEVPQAQALVVLIVADPFRWLKGPLAAPSQVLPKTE